MCQNLITWPRKYSATNKSQKTCVDTKNLEKRVHRKLEFCDLISNSINIIKYFYRAQ